MLDLDPNTTAALAIHLIGKKQELEALRGTADANPRIGGGLAAPIPGPGVSSAPLPPVASTGDQAAFIQNMSPEARTAAQATGLDPRVVLAQTALETGFGKSAPGNNYFGVKGPGQVLGTQEADASGNLVPTQDSFRIYPNAQASTQGYIDVMKQPNMAGVLQQPGMTGQIGALGRSGYATDPNYAGKVGAIAGQLSPLDPTDPTSAFVMGRPAQAGPTAPGGSPIDPNAQPPAFVQTGAPQAPAAPPVTVQAQPGQPTIPPTTLPQISPEALDLQRQADAARSTGTAEGLKKSIELSNKAQDVQRAHATKLQETVDTRTYAQQTDAQKTAQANAEHDRRKAAEDASKPLTESQAKEAGYYNRMRNATGTIEQFEAGGKPPTLGSNIGKNIPLVGAMTQKPDNQAYNAAKLDWISSQLRQETGANMPANEVAEMERRYFPQPGEGPDIIKQKAQARAVAEDAMKTGAGPNFKHVPTPIQPLPSKRQPPAEAISDLRANPGSAAQFDEVFGPGAAARALGAR